MKYTPRNAAIFEVSIAVWISRNKSP